MPRKIVRQEFQSIYEPDNKQARDCSGKRPATKKRLCYQFYFEKPLLEWWTRTMRTKRPCGLYSGEV